MPLNANDLSRLLLVALLALLPVWTAAADTHSSAEPDPAIAHIAQGLDSIVDDALKDGFAGGVAVYRSDSFLYVRTAGHSDNRGRVPVTDETLFHVASISKFFTAVLAMRAVDEGRITLDDDLRKWLPGSALTERKLTVGDLLAHQTGLGSSYAAEGITNQGKAIKALGKAKIDASRVGEFRYSNDGYNLLAILLEVAYDEKFEQIGRAGIIEPLALRAGFWGARYMPKPIAVGQPVDRIPRSLRKRNYGMLGSTGLLITARDLVQLMRAVLDGEVLTESSLQQLLKPRGTISIGQPTLGAFLVEHEHFGRTLSARGYEQWGDNAIVNHYFDHDITFPSSIWDRVVPACYCRRANRLLDDAQSISAPCNRGWKPLVRWVQSSIASGKFRRPVGAASSRDPTCFSIIAFEEI